MSRSGGEAVSIIVAFESERDREGIASILEKNGLSVRCACRTGQEVIRAVKQAGGGIVVAGYKFPDMTTEYLAHQMENDGVTILMAARGTLLDMVEDDDIFHIPVPFRPMELVGAVRMLAQLSGRRNKDSALKRTEDEKQLIGRAKSLLMDKAHYTEEQAHRYLQRQSMEMSMKMTEVAKLIIESYE